MKFFTKLAPKLLYFATLFTLVASMGMLALYLAVGPGLPDVDSIRDIRLQTPMRVYAADGQLMAEFGEKRRIPISLDEVPQNFINALLATEDQRFFEHSGVDFLGVLRAALNLALTGNKSQGASTITMLVARNYYLTREKRFSRKITEMFLAWKLEAELSKREILELFLNKIPFGHRAFGLGAAAQVYYGKPLQQLSLAQLATLAGIPKGQSKYNPVSYPHHALERRSHVLRRMLDEGFINQAQFEAANAEPIETYLHGAKTTISAPYFAEMVRRKIISMYGREAALGDGLKIFTTLDPKLQRFAEASFRRGLFAYDRRHGYRGAEANYPVTDETSEQQLKDWLDDHREIAGLQPAIVRHVQENAALVQTKDGQLGVIPLAELSWARRYIDENHLGPEIERVEQVLSRGDLIRVVATQQSLLVEDQLGLLQEVDSVPADQAQDTENKAEVTATDKVAEVTLPVYRLAQIPEAAGAFVSLNPEDGAITSLIGGLDFSLQQFNIVTQSRRQPGSNIKPFIYAAGFAKGYTPASIINDAPIIQSDITAGNFWRPKNDADRYRGPTRLREALYRSVNTVSIRLVRDIGPRYAKQFLTQLGLPADQMQAVPSLALGTASFTPLEVAEAYAILANGGYRVDSWFITRVEDRNGHIIYEAEPTRVCRACEELLASELLAKSPKLAEQNGDLNAVTGTQALQLPLEFDLNTLLEPAPKLPTPEDKIAPRVLDERIHYLIDDILKDVIKRGTAWRTLFNSRSPLLKRNDIAGKTGTTNDAKDAWFSGYNPHVVATAWVGFPDYSRSLGNREYGGKAALPIWQGFMEKALADIPQQPHPRPQGIVTVKIDPKTGKLATSLTPNPIFELFRSENVPTEYAEPEASNPFNTPQQEEEDESIF